MALSRAEIERQHRTDWRERALTAEALLARMMKAWPDDHVMGGPLAVATARVVNAHIATEGDRWMTTTKDDAS